jgi:penicillin-insensitive murein endopeptidase
MGPWKSMKEPMSLEEYVGEVPRPIPRPVSPDEWVQLPQRSAWDIGEPGAGYYSYGTVPAGQPGTTADAQWGEPKTIGVIQSVADQMAMGKKFTPFGVGNISLKGGQSFRRDHKEHDVGNRVDVRPVRRDGAPLPTTYLSPDYDRAATQGLIGAFLATGQVDKLYFNDPDIGIEGVTPDPDGVKTHDNHFHVQMKR